MRSVALLVAKALLGGLAERMISLAKYCDELIKQAGGDALSAMSEDFMRLLGQQDIEALRIEKEYGLVKVWEELRRAEKRYKGEPSC